MAAKQKKAGAPVMGTLSRYPIAQTGPEHTQACLQPNSPVTQCGSNASIRQSLGSAVPPDFAEDWLHQQDANSSAPPDLRDMLTDQQTASKHIIAQPRHTEFSWRSLLSSDADKLGRSRPQYHLCGGSDAVKAVATVRALPRPSSWQRRKAAKLCQAQQPLQEGRLPLLSQMHDPQLYAWIASFKCCAPCVIANTAKQISVSGTW